MADPEIRVLLTADDTDLDKDLGDAERKLTGFGKSGKIGLTALAAGFAAATAAAAKFVAVLNEWERLYQKQRDAEKQIERVVIATGKAAGFSSRELKKYASELQAVTNFGDEETLPAMTKLATFTRIAGEEFKRATALSQDLAATGFGDLEQMAVMLGKALNDPITGVTSLRRVGVTVTEQQKDMAKAFWEAGNAAKAQGVILDAVEGQVGGMARALANAETQLENLIGDLKEYGGQLWNAFKAPFVKKFFDELSVAADKAADRVDQVAAALYGVAEVAIQLPDKIAESFGILEHYIKFQQELIKGTGKLIANELDLVNVYDEATAAYLRRLRTARFTQNFIEEALAAQRAAAEAGQPQTQAPDNFFTGFAFDAAWKRRHEQTMAHIQGLRDAQLAKDQEWMDKWQKATFGRLETHLGIGFTKLQKRFGNIMSAIVSPEGDEGFQASLLSLTGMYDRITTAAASRRPEDKIAKSNDENTKATKENTEAIKNFKPTPLPSLLNVVARWGGP